MVCCQSIPSSPLLCPFLCGHGLDPLGRFVQTRPRMSETAQVTMSFCPCFWAVSGECAEGVRVHLLCPSLF